MGGPAFRGMVSCVLAVLFPFSLFAADSQRGHALYQRTGLGEWRSHTPSVFDNFLR
jgi:hypothetical protein